LKLIGKPLRYLPTKGDFTLRNLIITAVALLAAGTANAETYAIQAGRLIVDAAKPALGPSTVIVTDGRSGGSGRAVMPGMTDVHVHLTMNSGEPWYSGFTRKYSAPYATTMGLTHALEMARAGFTTVQDLGGDTSAVIALRDAVAEGRFAGPRIRVSGAGLSMIGGHGDPATGLPPELAAAIDTAHLNRSVCTGVQQCQEVVRKLASAGVDVIKIMATGGVLDPGAMGLEQHFTFDEMKGIVDMAHSLHLKVAAHAHGARGIEAATNAGVDSIEHGTLIDEAGVKAMKAHGTYYSATLMAFSGVNGLLGTGKLTPEMESKARIILARWGNGLNLAYRGGVKIALGTDSAVAPHARAGEELGLMVSKGGMTPRDALIAATKGGPDLMGLSAETGTLDPGKSADLIAVDGDPLSDPAAVTHVGYVMVMGRPIAMNAN
jgi:imidazolonepropionase-like amidohydrolase